MSGKEIKPNQQPPNVVLVTADSVRADYCGFLNPEMATTPALDKIAGDGLVFETAIAPGPRTPSSIPVIWTGEHVGNENMDVYENRSEKSSQWRKRRQRIKRHVTRFDTIAERFRRRGYDTGAVSTNPWTTTETGFSQGFDQFEAIDGVPSDGNVSIVKRFLTKASQIPKIPNTERWLLTWPDVYDRVLDVKESLEEPYFLWVFLLDAHQPYFASSDYREENTGLEMYYANVRYNQNHTAFEELPEHLETRLNAAYRDTIRSVDGFVEKMLNDFKNDDPAFVFHSDHGEALLEHGTRGHRPELYDENLRVPLLAHNVGTTGRISEQVTLRHLPEFLLSLADEEPNLDRLRQDPAIATTEENERIAVRTKNWKRIHSRADWDFVHETPINELYNLQADPTETENSFAEHREVAGLIDYWLDKHARVLDEREAIAEASRQFAQTKLSDPDE